MKISYPAACTAGLAPREHTIQAGGMRWHTLEWGRRGHPLVLWHGVRSSARNWWRVGPLLAGLGFHVWAPDMPGHGASGDSPLGYAIDATATLLDEWMAGLELDAPVVVGHSWGGFNALAHALLPAARVRSRAVALVDPPLALPDDIEEFVSDYTVGVGEVASDEAAVALGAAQPRWHSCDVLITLRAREMARRDAIDSFFRANAGVDLRDELATVSQPVLLLLGDADFGGLWTGERIAELRSQAPDVAIDVLHHASHNLYRDDFASFSRALARFVKRYV